MARKLIHVAFFTILCAAATGQTTQPASQPSEGYWLRVTGNEVNVRCRADRNSLVLLRVPKGTLLRAADETFGWHRIVPPPGVFSLVSADFVTPQGDGSGVVTLKDGRLRVRAGSDVAKTDPLRNEVQKLLEDGETVRLLGRDDSWYRIEPPAGVWAFISADFTERISDQEAGEPALARGGGAAEKAPEPAPGLDLSGEWGRRLVAAEKLIQAQRARPVDERSWDESLNALRPIAAQRSEPQVAEVARQWVLRLEQRAAEQATLRAAREQERRDEAARVRLEEELRQIQNTRARALAEAFTARGELQAAAAVDPATGRRLYKLQNPLTQRLEVYVEFTPEAFQAGQALVGKYVGVKGTKSRDAKLAAELIRVTHIEAIQPRAEGTAPAEPAPAPARERG